MIRRFVPVLTLLLAAPAALRAQTTVSLPDTSRTTTLTANVSEQARVSVPAGVTFNVTDVSAATAASGASVSVSNIVLATDTKQLRILVKAGAPSFTPPVAGATTWDAGDVTWNAPAWTNATATAGTLSDASYDEIATCDADVASCSTNALVFTLGAKGSVKRAGNHSLTVTWKFESIGS